MSLHPLDSLEKVKKYNLDQMRNDVHKLKEVFVDTIKFAIDKDLVKYLYTQVMLRNIHKKAGKIRSGLNDIIETENIEIFYKKKTEVLDRIAMLSESLKDILLELSYIEIRIQYNQDPLLVESHMDMTVSEKIVHMLFLIQHGLYFQNYFGDPEDSEEFDEPDDLDD